MDNLVPLHSTPPKTDRSRLTTLHYLLLWEGQVAAPFFFLYTLPLLYTNSIYPATHWTLNTTLYTVLTTLLTLSLPTLYLFSSLTLFKRYTLLCTLLTTHYILHSAHFLFLHQLFLHVTHYTLHTLLSTLNTFSLPTLSLSLFYTLSCPLYTLFCCVSGEQRAFPLLHPSSVPRDVSCCKRKKQKS